MNRGVWIAIGFILGVLFMIWFNGGAAEGAPPPPAPTQQRPDIFPCVGCVLTDQDGDGDGDLQDINPVTKLVKQTKSVRYRVVLKPGCNYGSYDDILGHMNTVEAPKVGLDLGRNDTSYRFTVFISCGLEHVNKCGGINIFCLPDGFPGNCDVYMSDVLSSWDAGSKQGIPIHEIIAHCIGTWNEQYQACGASCNFAATPNHRDVMNTGPLSRHGIEAIECARWMRTMYQDIPCAYVYGYLTVDCSGPTVIWPGGVVATWNPCLESYGRWVGSNGVDYDPANGDLWYFGIRMWSACNGDGYRWNYYEAEFRPPFHTSYRPELGYWNEAPAC